MLVRRTLVTRLKNRQQDFIYQADYSLMFDYCVDKNILFFAFSLRFKDPSSFHSVTRLFQRGLAVFVGRQEIKRKSMKSQRYLGFLGLEMTGSICFSLGRTRRVPPVTMQGMVKNVISEQAAISHFQGLTAHPVRKRSFRGQLGLSATFGKNNFGKQFVNIKV